MPKINAQDWERVVADAGATAVRDVNAEGVEGSDNLAPLLTPAAYDSAGVAAPSGVRRLIYATLRALQVPTPTAWQPIAAFSGWSTGLDGRRPAQWRRGIDGRIHLRGRFSGSATGYVGGPLPFGARPRAVEIFNVPAFATSSASFARLAVLPEGWLFLEAWHSGGHDWIELGAVSFDLG